MTADSRRFVIVGASLAGLRAAEALRDAGFAGSLTIVGDELHPPYDRPPLSKQVALGMAAPERTGLPRARPVGADWRLGTAAAGLDLSTSEVRLSSGEALPFDRLLIATGTRARPWPDAQEAKLDGVLTLRTCEDAACLRAALIAAPRRVVVIGGGFNGSELASICCDLGIPVTLVEHNETPLAGALGTAVGNFAAGIQRRHGVDLRCGAKVERLEGDAAGHVRRVHLAGGDEPVEADLVVVALGSMANVEWLKDSGLAVRAQGVTCDVGCRAFDQCGVVTDDVFVAGDIARFPHPLFNYEFMTLEHWGNAVEMARVAARNMVAVKGRRAPHLAVPTFWSSQFDVSIKSVGVPTAADQVAFVQGSPEEGRFVAVYGRKGRLVAAVTFDHGKWLEHYLPLIEAGADFPGQLGLDAGSAREPMAAGFPHPMDNGLDAYITLSGQVPTERHTILHRPGA